MSGWKNVTLLFQVFKDFSRDDIYFYICTLDAKSIKFNVWHQQLVSKTILQLEDLIMVMVWLDFPIKRWRAGP